MKYKINIYNKKTDGIPYLIKYLCIYNKKNSNNELYDNLYNETFLIFRNIGNEIIHLKSDNDLMLYNEYKNYIDKIGNYINSTVSEKYGSIEIENKLKELVKEVNEFYDYINDENIKDTYYCDEYIEKYDDSEIEENIYKENENNENKDNDIKEDFGDELSEA